MTTVVPDRLGRRRLARFERASIDLSWSGSQPLPDRAAIHHEYYRARQLMLEHLDSQALAIVDWQERSRCP